MKERPIGEYKGLWYIINAEVIDLTNDFYNTINLHITDYYNEMFNTRKFEAYVKKRISIVMFELLKSLHQRRFSGNEITITKSPITEYVAAYMEKKYDIKCKWVTSHFPWLFMYYGWLVLEIIKRGITSKKKKSYKLCKEAAWGFTKRILRDDIVIADKRFKKEDLLLLKFYNSVPRIKAFEEAKKRGFDTASMSKLKININRNILNVLFFYFIVPLQAYIKLLLRKQLYLVKVIIDFHKGCFPIELLMNLYKIKCYISTKDWGDVEETIMLNKYKTKSVLFHWSDLSAYRSVNHAFIAHNVYFAWGDAHSKFKGGLNGNKIKELS